MTITRSGTSPPPPCGLVGVAPTTQGRPNRVEISASALRHNVGVVRSALQPGTRLYAAVKANAYGHGLVPASLAFCEAGVDGLSMADPADAVALREAGITTPILLYSGGLIDAEFVAMVERYKVHPTVLDQLTADALAASARAPLPVFVEIDCGLGRTGVPAENAPGFIASLSGNSALRLDGIYAHLHVPKADAACGDYLSWQIERFRGVTAALDSMGVRIPIRILDSTGMIEHGIDSGVGGADPGHLLYGLSSGAKVHAVLPVRPALFSISSRLIQVRCDAASVPRDARGPFQRTPGMRFGVIPFGLRDGIAQIWTGEALVAGRRTRLLGAPSLEHTRVDLTGIEDARIGSEVVLVGQQGTEAISPDDVARLRGHARVTDFLVAVPASVPRATVDDRSAA